MITQNQRFSKRVFDLCLGFVLFPIFIFPIVILVILSSIDTRIFGFFKQKRVGQKGELFNIYKIRTLRNEKHDLGDLNKSATKLGKFLRKTKLDELPQLINVLIGDMSFVGPRPDVEGFADELVGDDRIILTVKPGITGPATIKYKNEDELLKMQDNPEDYNRTIIWTDKVEINKNYVKNWSFYLDLKYILQSILN